MRLARVLMALRRMVAAPPAPEFAYHLLRVAVGGHTMRLRPLGVDGRRVVVAEAVGAFAREAPSFIGWAVGLLVARVGNFAPPPLGANL